MQQWSEIGAAAAAGERIEIVVIDAATAATIKKTASVSGTVIVTGTGTEGGTETVTGVVSSCTS